MSPFYAYAINRQSDTYSRVLLIFANRTVADEWWRAISKDPVLNNIRRFTPQFYSYDISEVNLLQFFRCHKDIADKFVDRMLIQWDNDMSSSGRGISILPSVDITDHISGNWYHIRSKVDPRLYWFHQKTKDWIILSDDCNARTAFRITALEEPEGTIMVGKDKIIIAAPGLDIGVHADQDGCLRSGGDTTAFTFQDFTQGKFFLDEYGDLRHTSNIRAQQEVWELVCSYDPPNPV